MTSPRAPVDGAAIDAALVKKVRRRSLTVALIAVLIAVILAALLVYFLTDRTKPEPDVGLGWSGAVHAGSRSILA